MRIIKPQTNNIVKNTTIRKKKEKTIKDELNNLKIEISMLTNEIMDIKDKLDAEIENDTEEEDEPEDDIN